MNIPHPYQKLFCSLRHQSFFFCLVAIFIVSAACSKKSERRINIDTPRELTSLDETSNAPSPPTQQAQPSQVTPALKTAPYQYSKPDQWIEQPATPFRKINFTFATKGEVYLSQSRGGILPNANRWFNQFGTDGVDSVAQLEQTSILSSQGYIVVATGPFQGMGMASAVADYKLLGALVEIDGNLITIKMTGPAAEVEAQEGAFRAFCASLKLPTE